MRVLGAYVEDREVETGGRDPLRHRGAHRPESYKSDTFHLSLPEDLYDPGQRILLAHVACENDVGQSRKGAVLGQYPDGYYAWEHLASDLGPAYAETAGADVTGRDAALRHHERERQPSIHPAHHLHERVGDRNPDLESRPARAASYDLSARVHDDLGIGQPPVDLRNHP